LKKICLPNLSAKLADPTGYGRADPEREDDEVQAMSKKNAAPRAHEKFRDQLRVTAFAVRRC